MISRIGRVSISAGSRCSLLSAIALVVLGCGGATNDEGERPSRLRPQISDAGAESEEVEGQGAAGGPSAADQDLAPTEMDVGAGDNVPDDAPDDPAPQLTPTATVPTSTSTPDPALNPVPVDPGMDDPPPDVEIPPPPVEPCAVFPEATEREIARRLERVLWDVETGELAAAIDDGSLHLDTPQAIEAQARLMLEDPRAEEGLMAFVKRWLKLTPSYLLFEEPLFTSVVESTDRTLAALLFGLDGEPPRPVSSLFADNLAVVDGAVAEFYGIEAPDSEWQLVELPQARSLGLLTQALWLNVAPNPPWRGAELRRSLVCSLRIPAPPPGIPPVRDLGADSELTNRETYEVHTSEPACAGCHVYLDPIGFGFEHFDGVGAYRSEDRGMPVDASGQFVEYELEFDGTEELQQLLLGELSTDVETCLVQHVVEAAAWQGDGTPTYQVPAFEPGCFEQSNALPEERLGATLQDWLLAIVVSDTFRAAYE